MRTTRGDKQVKGKKKSLKRTKYQNTSMRFRFFRALAHIVPKTLNVMASTVSFNTVTAQIQPQVFEQNVNGPIVQY